MTREHEVAAERAKAAWIAKHVVNLGPPQYSGAHFDLAQGVARVLTDIDRSHGGGPAHGYSRDNFERAERAIAEARSWRAQ